MAITQHIQILESDLVIAGLEVEHTSMGDKSFLGRGNIRSRKTLEYGENKEILFGRCVDSCTLGESILWK